MNLDKKNSFKNKYLKKIILLFCYAIVVSVLVRYFWNIDWQKLFDIEVDMKILCLAVFFMLVIKFFYPTVWVFILKEFGQKINNYWELNFVYAKAWLGRYIPGKIAWIGGKIFFGSQQGLDVKILTFGSLLESIIQVTANLALGLFVISINDKGVLGPSLTFFSFASLILLLISIFPPIFNRVVNISYKFLKKKDIDDKYKFRFVTLLKTSAIFLLISIFLGVPFTLICKSVSPTFDIISNFFFIVGVSSLAGSIGILAVFAPSGLGVREGVLAVFFSALFPKEIVFVILILMRLVVTVVDLFFFLISKGIFVIRKKRGISENLLHE